MIDRRRYRERWFYALVASWFLGFLAFQLSPILASFSMSLYRGMPGVWKEFIGFANYREIVRDPTFLRASVNTAYFAAGTVLPGVIFAFVLALLLDGSKPANGLFRIVFFLPVVTSGVALTMVWGWLLNPQLGFVNGVLSSLGIPGPGWFHDETWAMPSIIVMNLFNLGTNLVVYIAAIRGVPSTSLDAARIEGAGGLSIVARIIWPLVSPATLFLIVTNLIVSTQIFTPAYLLTRGGPNDATLTVSLFIYRSAFAWQRFGYASASAILLFVFVLALTILQLRLAGRWVFDPYEPARRARSL